MIELPLVREDGYVPILKVKEGELRALGDLGADVKGRLTPLFEMVPSGDDHAPGEHADRRVGRLAKVWEMGRQPVLMDLHLQLEYDSTDPWTAHSLVAEAAERHEVAIIPVVRPRDPEPFLDAATALAADRELGSVAIRIRQRDTLVDLGAVTEQILMSAHVDPDEAHVIVDLEDDIDPEDARLLLGRVPYAHEWASVTLAAGAFERPGNYRTHRVPRHGWHIWEALHHEGELPTGRHVTFGDYGTLRAEYQDYSDVPAGAMRVPVRLVYTSRDHWLHVVRRYDPEAAWDGIYEVCREIASSPDWYGPEYSPGDEAIALRARGEGSTGGPTEWIRWAIAHHLTLVTRTLASRSGS